MSLARDQEYQAVISKPGYETQTTEVHSSFSAATLVDLIFIIPWAVDLADGAAYSLEPESTRFRLQPQLASATAAAAKLQSQLRHQQPHPQLQRMFQDGNPRTNAAVTGWSWVLRAAGPIHLLRTIATLCRLC